MNSNKLIDDFNTLQGICKINQARTNYKLPENSKYVLIHCDGRSFSKFIKKKFARPFDKQFVTLMNETARYVAEKIQGCVLAYVQSDEITFVIQYNENSQMFFGGRLNKMQSIIAAMCSTKFVSMRPEQLVEFDCKVWNVDSYQDVINWLIFRQEDCIRNSKLQTAQTYLSHKELLNKSPEEAITLLKEKGGIDWRTDIAPGCKIGRMVYKIPIEFENEYGKFVRNKFTITEAIYLNDPEKLKKFEELNIIDKDV
jgi:tRNA(His) 5'-end guanylyltransferase